MDLLIVLIVAAFIVYYLPKRREPLIGRFTIYVKGRKMRMSARLSNNLFSIGDITLRGIRVNFPIDVPHILVDSHTNDYIVAGLPFHVREKQRIELEGDFYKNFSVYTPKATQLEALQILTPDVMNMLMDQGGAYDIELVDRHMKIICTQDAYDEYVQKDLVAFTEKFSQQIAEQLFNTLNTTPRKYPHLAIDQAPTVKVWRRAFNAHKAALAVFLTFVYGLATLLTVSSWQHAQDTPRELFLALIESYFWVSVIMAVVALRMWYEFRKK